MKNQSIFDRSVSYLPVFLFFILCYSFPAQAQTVEPLFITEPVANDSDDPAVWINKSNPEESLIIGTDKDANGALYVFDTEGEIIDDKVVGNLERPNNVDVAYGMMLNGEKVDIAVTTERFNSKLRVFSLPDMEAVDGDGIPVFEGESGDFNSPMGIGLYTRPSDGNIYAIVSRKNGPENGTYLWQYLLEDDGQGNVKGTLVRRFGNYSGKKEIEAIAVDNELGYVYYSDEGVGVRKYYADPDQGDQELALFATTGFEQDHEGIAIYKIEDGTGYILVSDQAADQIQVFPREGTDSDVHEHPLIKVIQLGAESMDGIEVINYPILPHFPNCLFVAMSDDRTYHFYRWEDIAGDDLRVEPPGDRTDLSPPAMVSPADDATEVSLSPVLNWEALDGATSYQAQVSTSSDFSGTVYDQSDITDTEASVSDLSYSTVYYWRVRAFADDVNSDWSEVWNFTTESEETSPPSPEEALVALWKMDEGSGKVLIDASSQGNDASIIGDPDWREGVSGLALQIYGRRKYAVAPDNASLDITEAITLSAWIRPKRRSTQYVIKKAVIYNTDGYELSLSSRGKVFFRINQASSGNTYRLDSKATYPTDGKTWMHIAATYDGSAIRIYINGEENSVKVLSSPPSIAENSLALGIGAQSDGIREFQGTLDELRVYNIALKASDIHELANISSSTELLASGKKEPEEAEAEEMLAYPNPFNSQLMVTFSLPEDGPYAVSLHNIKGIHVAMLKQGNAIAGEENIVTYDGAELPKGLYLLRLQTEEEISTIMLVH